MLLSLPSVGDGTTDFLVGWDFGEEYLFDQHFSLGADAQLNMTKSDDMSARFANPGKWTVNTATAVFATVYF